MTHKELFIQAMHSMVDSERIFIASADFWSAMFDRINAGEPNIDPTFVTVFKTVLTVLVIQDNPMLIRAEQEFKNRRMLLDALKHRLDGYSVTIMSNTVGESRYMQNLFFSIVDDLVDGTTLKAEQKERFDHGQISFNVIHEVTMRDIHITGDGVGLYGYSQNHKLFLTQAVYEERYIKRNDPFITLMNKYTRCSTVDSFITKAEVTLRNKHEQRYKQQKAMIDISQSAPSASLIEGFFLKA